MKTKILLVMMLTVFSLAVQAEDKFEPWAWTPGLHLFAGGGLNSSVYTSSDTRLDAGVGLNIKADLGYYLNDRWALEWSSSVKFNHVEKYLIWDTLLTLGARYRFDSNYFADSSYARFFIGRSPTVVFFNGETPAEISDEKVSRIQFDGPALGAAWGVMNKTRGGTIWFFELAGSVQKLEQLDGIEMHGEVPVVIVSDRAGNDSHIYSIYATIGVLVF